MSGYIWVSTAFFLALMFMATVGPLLGIWLGAFWGRDDVLPKEQLIVATKRSRMPDLDFDAEDRATLRDALQKLHPEQGWSSFEVLDEYAGEADDPQ